MDVRTYVFVVVVIALRRRHRNFVSGRKWRGTGGAGAIAWCGSRPRARSAQIRVEGPERDGCA